MWFLGAGASAAAGIPTAGDMIWEFKQRLYVSQRRVSPRSVQDLGNPAIRARLQSYFDASPGSPPAGSPDEYAHFFEAAWPNESDRRAYIDAKISGAKPSYGHLALATFMRGSLARLAWTTNFDPLVADACAKVYEGTGALTSIALDAPELAREVLKANRWPIEMKLHGDFRSRRLKNTGEELRHQDALLRQTLVDSCRNYGMIVVGYSGRDTSIMEALSQAISLPNSFPGGLFWLHRNDSEPPPSVTDILQMAAKRNIDGGLVKIENFDEILRDLVRVTDGLQTKVLDEFAAARQHWTPAPRASGRKTFPVLRLNAIPVEVSPTVCRRIVCEIGGYTEVRDAIESSGIDAVVTRTRAGILAFGSDVDLRTAFKSYGITEFDLHTIEAHRLRYDSGERGLLRDALSRALAGALKVELLRRRSSDLLYPTDPNDADWRELKVIVGALAGTVNGHPELHWKEGAGIRLEWADDRAWLVFEPRTIFVGATEENKFAATDFARERTVRRYNRALNSLIGFWATRLAHSGLDLYSLNVSAGIDAVFRLSSDTAYSRRVGA